MDKSTKLGKGVRFERIRRITGYLVGTLDRWNNAKKAEERDRVKHSTGAALHEAEVAEDAKRTAADPRG